MCAWLSRLSAKMQIGDHDKLRQRVDAFMRRWIVDGFWIVFDGFDKSAVVCAQDLIGWILHSDTSRVLSIPALLRAGLT
jgi:hypothetical protein